jgi:hypothetical protein
MIPGIYVLRPGEVEVTRRFESMGDATAVMRPGDLVLMVGPDGRELGRWTRNKEGLLLAIQKSKPGPGAPMGPRARIIRDRNSRSWLPRRRGYVPPAGGRGPDGRPRTWPKPATQTDLANAQNGDEGSCPQAAEARPSAVSCTSRREDEKPSTA